MGKKEIRFSDKKLFMKNFRESIKKLFWELNLKKVKVAFDIAEDLVWSKSDCETKISVY